MDENWFKELALDFNKLTGKPAYFYDIDNWLYKAENGEIIRMSKQKPEKIETTIIIDEVEKYLTEII